MSAPAKVNLHLEVLGRRPDGFHDVVSLLQSVDLADMLEFRTAGPPGGLRLTGSFAFPDSENTIAKAVACYRAAIGAREGLVVEVEKRTPVGGGLGGGSSDAAATLRALQALFGRPLQPGVLAEIARDLGSDVPFFVDAAAAVVEGRGDRIRPVRPRTDYHIVAVTPPLSVSTARAFACLDEDRACAASPSLSGDRLERSYREGAPALWPFANSFDEPVMRRNPLIAGARDRLREAGALAPRLTGSGSTVIGLFDDAASARACVAALRGAAIAGERVRILRPLDSLPRVVYYG